MRSSLKGIGLILFLIFQLQLFWSAAQISPIGRWKTLDDDTGEPKSIVEIFPKNGKLFGRIVKLFQEPNEDPDPICDKCTDHRKDQKILGMIILGDMTHDGGEWSGGEIMDPENGKTYRCRIWIENGTLKVRGYIAFLYRTQTWLPV